MAKISAQKIREMAYVDFMAFLHEVNRPPGGKDSIRILIQNCFITQNAKVLDVGCNTGYVSFEIAHLAKCSVVGVDINKNMIKAAEKIRKGDPLGHLVKFRIADAANLPLQNETFDVVVSGGSTAFIDDKVSAIQECKRILRQWGFIGDINFFYRVKPPTSLIKKLNSILGIEIHPWDLNYWINLYEHCGLEKYFIYSARTKSVSRRRVENYCSAMADKKNLPEDARRELRKKLVQIMNIFNENHKYLDYGIFIFRKRPSQEQISLFGA